MSHYTVGLPAREQGFYGRQAELASLFGGNTYDQGWKWVCAQRRMGKTSLLYRAQQAVSQRGGIALLYDLAVVDPEDASGKVLFKRFLDSQKRTLQALGWTASKLKFAAVDSAAAFRALAEKLLERFSEVVFLFDEAERLIDVERREPGFLARLRAELHALPGFRFVVGSTQLLSQLFQLDSPSVSSYLSTFSFLPLAGLDDADAAALLRCAHTAGWKTPLSDSVVTDVLEWTGGHPLLLQELGMSVAQLAQFDGRSVTPKMLYQCRQKIVANVSLLAIVADDYRRLTATQRKLVDALCEADDPLMPSEAMKITGEARVALEKAAASLQNFGYLHAEEPWRLRLGFYRQMRPSESPPSEADEARVERSSSGYRRRHSVFISYSHEDTEFLTALTKMLAPALPHHNIDLWDDRRIKAGDAWRQEIDGALEQADVAVLLISTGFLNSQFITQIELPSLLGRAAHDKLRILLLFVKHSLVDKARFKIRGESRPLTYFQGLNTPDQPIATLEGARRDEELMRVSNKILAGLADLDKTR